METIIDITECRRTTMTRNGNPRFIITDSTGKTYRTAPDSNSVFTVVDGRTGMARVHTNHRGQITEVDYLPTRR